MGSHPLVWCCNRQEDMLLRAWADGDVLFDEAQGQLHCLSPASGEVMRLLLKGRAWTAFEIAKELLGESPTDDDVQMVENVALHFHTLNLIDRLPV